MHVSAQQIGPKLGLYLHMFSKSIKKASSQSATVFAYFRESFKSRSGFRLKNNINKHTSQRGKFYHYIQNTFLDSRSILGAIWDGPKSLFRYHKTQKMEIFKTLFFLNFGPVRPKQISSAHTFEIRKVHQKCSFSIFYNV